MRGLCCEVVFTTSLLTSASTPEVCNPLNLPSVFVSFSREIHNSVVIVADSEVLLAILSSCHQFLPPSVDNFTIIVADS